MPVALGAALPNCSGVSDKDPLAQRSQREAPRWTRPEDYLDMGRLWRRSAARLRRRLRPRTEPERPRFTLGTLPFMLLILALMIVAVAVIIAAVPVRRYDPPKPVPHEQGTAPPGWLRN